MKEPIATYLARNIQELRIAKSLTQAQLAEAAGVPRSTLTNMESGSSNPSLDNLMAIAGALKVGVEVLLSKPRREVEHIMAHEIPVQARIQGRARIYKLLPDKIKGMNIDRMEIDKGAHMPGHAHLRSTKEYLTVLEGEITVQTESGKSVVMPGDVLAFEGDQPHSYFNSGTKLAKAISVVIPFGI